MSVGGRKVEDVVVPMEWGERDAGKRFRITEMSAYDAEKWAMRAFLLLKRSGERVPENVASLGMVGVFIVGINVFLQGSIEVSELEPLMDQMMSCVGMVRDPHFPDVVTPISSPEDIGEVRTRLWLRSEIIRVHTGFSPAEALSRLISAINIPENSSTTSTSPP